MRKELTPIVLLGAACLLSTTLDTSAQQTWRDKISTLTVTDPVEVPGRVLEPGTYVIKVIKVQSNRNIVQITDAAETKVFATTIATPNEKRKPEPNTTFAYYPAARGRTKTLRTWFAPNDPHGQDLVYPKARATELAQASQVTVYSIPSDFVVSGELKDDEPLVTPVQPIEMRPAETYEPTMVAESKPAPAVVPSSTRPEEELPRTASTLPLALGLGLLSLGGAAALRASARS